MATVKKHMTYRLTNGYASCNKTVIYVSQTLKYCINAEEQTDNLQVVLLIQVTRAPSPLLTYLLLHWKVIYETQTLLTDLNSFKQLYKQLNLIN